MEKIMNAKEMNKFTTDNIFLGIETLKDSIKKEITHQSNLKQFNTERDFSNEVSLQTRFELVNYLRSEGYYSTLLNSNQTIYVSWGETEYVN